MKATVARGCVAVLRGLSDLASLGPGAEDTAQDRGGFVSAGRGNMQKALHIPGVVVHRVRGGRPRLGADLLRRGAGRVVRHLRAGWILFDLWTRNAGIRPPLACFWRACGPLPLPLPTEGCATCTCTVSLNNVIGW